MERPGREKSVGRSSGSWAGLVSGISNNRLTGVVLIVFPEDPGKLECLAAADREPEPHLLLAHPLPPRRELVTVGARLAPATLLPPPRPPCPPCPPPPRCPASASGWARASRSTSSSPPPPGSAVLAAKGERVSKEK